MLEGTMTAVLDLETLHSAAEVPTGWDDKNALGLSIGCYYSYLDGMYHWFDRPTLEATMVTLLDYRVVSFNGLGFDFPLMRAVLRNRADHLYDEDPPGAVQLRDLCDTFKRHVPSGYDILDVIWRVDPQGKFRRGINGLDAICTANGLPAKKGDGTLAPQWWAKGEIARTLEYCQHDVWLTKTLFERLIQQKGAIFRGDNNLITLPLPPWVEVSQPA